MLDRESALGIAKRYASAVRRQWSPQAIILFGSYVNGIPSEESDIDIAVLFDEIVGDTWEVSSQLWGLTRQIDCRIEPILLDATKDQSGFVAEVVRTGILIPA